MSVIIPVYNAEKYLRGCMDSVLSQTLRELEVICVDDGSTDGSAAILEEYAEKDSRVRVLRQENKGVAAARNAGLSAALSDWIGWVDSDDWIEPDMFEYLLQNAENYGADIATCGHVDEFNKSITVKTTEQVLLLDTEGALRMLLENSIVNNVLWDKLWKKDLFNGISFPEGRTFEDIAIMHKLFERASKTVFLPNPKYHYVHRPNSITGNKALANRINDFIAAKDRYDEMKDTWPQFRTLLEEQCIVSSICIWCGFLYNPKKERDLYRQQITEISQYARSFKSTQVVSQIKLGAAGQIVARLIRYDQWWSFGIAALVSFLYKLKHGKAL